MAKFLEEVARCAKEVAWMSMGLAMILGTLLCIMLLVDCLFS